jgi:hypothetical protein
MSHQHGPLWMPLDEIEEPAQRAGRIPPAPIKPVGDVLG